MAVLPPSTSACAAVPTSPPQPSRSAVFKNLPARAGPFNTALRGGGGELGAAAPEQTLSRFIFLRVGVSSVRALP